MIKITTTHERPPAATLAALDGILKTSQQAQALDWHKQVLPGHFKPGAKDKYGHRPRPKGYQDWKRGRHQRGLAEQPATDNVLTGATRRALSGTPSLTSTARAVDLNMPGPSYLSAQQAAELTSVTRTEARELTAGLGASVAQKIDRLKKPQTIRS